MRLIDADKFEVVGGKVPEGYDVDSYLAGNNEILEMIDNAPTVDAVPVVHGHWIEVRDKYNCKMGEKCSVCGRRVRNMGENYCPKCGAKMDLEV